MNKYKQFSFILLAALIVFVPRFAVAQLLVPAGTEMISESSGGEVTATLGNYWDGVDSEDDLCVNVGRALVLDNVGRMVDTAMPSCPNFIDMNGDGLKDLVVADTQGFVWIYLNSGEKGKPQFTTGKFVPSFIGWASKIHVCDWDGDGDYDVVVGTYYGDVVIMENFGNKQEWRFTRKMGVPRYVDPQFNVDDPQERLRQIMVGKLPMLKGNYISPWVCDWNKDGKPDLLLGEGTYSANSVRLFVNTGSRMKPVFSEEREFYLAYGEGFEQLTPCVLDYNGDGIDDLIVGTRTGQVRLHKGTKKATEEKDFIAAMKGTLAPAILEYEGYLNIGGKEVFDTMSTLYPCDWNEDGLFDLLVGSTKGKVCIAINKGTKTKPEFPTLESVKGTDVEKDLITPDGWWNGIARVWWINYIGGFCNTAVLLTCEKELILKQGAAPIKPVAGETFMYYRYVHNYPGWIRNNLAHIGLMPGSSGEHFVGGRLISPKQTFKLVLGKKYMLSFSSILLGKPAIWKFWITETTSLGNDVDTPKWEHREVSGSIPPSTTWVKRDFNFKCPSTFQTNANYNFFFRMPEGECSFFVDGLSLKELTE